MANLSASLIKEKPLKVIYIPDFDNPKLKRKIIGDMPNQADFDEKKRKIVLKDEITGMMRPLYGSPLLNKEQEYHLFRKMNYFKYCAKKLMSKKRFSEEKVKSFLDKADEVRNLIANCNFRLVTKLSSKRRSFMKDYHVSQEIISDAYTDVLRCVDYFNYSIGNKFSTYCVPVLFRNFARRMQESGKFKNRFVTGQDEDIDGIKNREDGILKNSHEENATLVKDLLQHLVETEHDPRYSYIIKEYFGLNPNGKKRNCEEMKEEFKITKSRIQQLKEKGMNILREKVKQLGINKSELL